MLSGQNKAGLCPQLSWVLAMVLLMIFTLLDPPPRGFVMPHSPNYFQNPISWSRLTKESVSVTPRQQENHEKENNKVESDSLWHPGTMPLFTLSSLVWMAADVRPLIAQLWQCQGKVAGGWCGGAHWPPATCPAPAAAVSRWRTTRKKNPTLLLVDDRTVAFLFTNFS